VLLKYPSQGNDNIAGSDLEPGFSSGISSSKSAYFVVYGMDSRPQKLSEL